MSDCGCVYVGDDDGDLQFCTVVERKARKEHKCTACERTIERGEHYEYYSGKGLDYGFWQDKTCSDCLSVVDSLFCKGRPANEAMYECLRVHVIEMEGKISSDCIVPLTPRAREKVCEVIEEAWETLDKREAQLEKMRERKTANIHG